MKKSIVIKDGCVTGFVDEVDFDGLSIESSATKRVSHVVPKSWLKRYAFNLLRKCVSDESKVAGWTRLWSGDWVVLIDDEVFGSFSERKKAIEFEKAKILEMGKLKSCLDNENKN